jgi:nitrile hydratase subunit beta
MTWPADMGGMHGFGPIKPERDEPLFHADWERRVLGLTLAAGATGSWTIDQSRHARETLPPLTYWSASYYEIWLEGLTKLLRDRGLVTNKDLWARKVVDPAKPVKRVLKADQVAGVLAKGARYDREASSTPRFKVGDRVRTLNHVSAGHTRLPGYVRMKQGVISLVHGCHVYPDSSGMGLGDDPRWLYGVTFTAQELWGMQTRDQVSLDLWEPYMEPAA